MSPASVPALGRPSVLGRPLNAGSRPPGLSLVGGCQLVVVIRPVAGVVLSRCQLVVVIGAWEGATTAISWHEPVAGSGRRLITATNSQFVAVAPQVSGRRHRVRRSRAGGCHWWRRPFVTRRLATLTGAPQGPWGGGALLRSPALLAVGWWWLVALTGRCSGTGGACCAHPALLGAVGLDPPHDPVPEERAKRVSRRAAATRRERRSRNKPAMAHQSPSDKLKRIRGLDQLDQPRCRWRRQAQSA